MGILNVYVNITYNMHFLKTYINKMLITITVISRLKCLFSLTYYYRNY